MDFLKRNLYWFICGFVAFGGAALGYTGWRGMPEVKKAMEDAASTYRNLDSLQSSPVNQDSIDAEQARIDQIQSDFQKVLQAAEKLTDYEPLVPEAFPDGPPLKRVEFRNKYSKAMEALFKKLNAGTLPTLQDINKLKVVRENELAEARDKGSARRRTGGGRTEANVLTAEGIRSDPIARAAVAKALSFYLYAVHYNNAKPPERVASLEFHKVMRDLGTIDAPPAFDVWRAQLTYWIQRDVVNAIVELNDEAGVEAKKAHLPRWVGTMAVKELTSVRVSEYVPAEGELTALAPPGGSTEALPPGTGESVFTGDRSGENFEVLQFSVKLVMDQRDIGRLIDKICRNRFHTLVRAAYTAVPVNREFKGKIYGSEPAVSVVLDFETIMLGEVFRPMIPAETCELYEINCPEREVAEEEG